jgi:single-stranded-DNA-specific exonuclease
MLKLDIAGRVVTAVAWGEGDSARHFERIKAIDIVYQPQLNEWQGRRELRLELKDFRSARGADAPPHPVIM